MSIGIMAELKYLIEKMDEVRDSNSGRRDIIYETRAHMDEYFTSNNVPHVGRIGVWNNLEPLTPIELIDFTPDGHKMYMLHSPLGTILCG